MKTLIITIFAILSTNTYAQNNINEISKKSYINTQNNEINKVVIEKEKINQQIYNLNMQFISKRTYVSPIK